VAAVGLASLAPGQAIVEARKRKRRRERRETAGAHQRFGRATRQCHDHVRLGEAPAEPFVALFEDVPRRRGPSRRSAIAEAVWTSRFHVQHRIARSPRKGRILLCGDAAHVHSPAGGQGMNTGVQDAISLARALDAAPRGGEEALLDEWARRRHAVAANVVATTDRLTRLATMKSGVGRSLRNAVIGIAGRLPPIQGALARKLAELDN